MSDTRAHTNDDAELPYPDGWFAVAYQAELKPGQVLRRRLMGEDIVVYRTCGGAVRVVEPHCPHLGAHLGYGGRVEGENLICPFHHFAYAPGGACVRAYGGKVPKLALRGREFRERNGVIMVWRHAAGLPPQWEIPELGEDGFTAPLPRTMLLTAYPQDIHENAFDVGHFPTLHDYRSATITSTSFEGTRSTCRLVTERYFPVIGALHFPVYSQGFGLSLSYVQVKMPSIGAQGFAYIYTTPVGPRQMELRVLSASRFGGGETAPKGALGRVSVALSRLLTLALRPSTDKDFDADGPVWEHKRYVNLPRLAEGDGPIGPYRRWARQFYTWPSAAPEQLPGARAAAPHVSQRP
ncbi:Rieske 2Fe-2S domain-containing protein [Streptomyces sp. NBC_01092]|uniref:Rieske 2Fe-2S domain-containing protein n=1 Tax=Streptomyces sp. NBC_01092 TaxID=2903748 RepID=UPI00386ECFC3|nr:Rieske 2Fe-2S domain-containing protein [Streptomyces sp. NBC_01092]